MVGSDITCSVLDGGESCFISILSTYSLKEGGSTHQHALKKSTLLQASRTVIVWISGENKHCQWHKSMIRKIATDILRGDSEWKYSKYLNTYQLEAKKRIMRQLKTLQGTIVTHILKSQGHCQQARNMARHHSHSHTGEPRKGIVSRLETQQGTTATHILESQGQALSAG